MTCEQKSAATSDWFVFTPMGEGITHIIETDVHPLMQCNIWHIKGRDRDILIDTGLGIEDLHRAALEVFGRPQTAIATHTHADHAGGMSAFQERWVHKAEAWMARTGYFSAPLSFEAWDEADLCACKAAGYDLTLPFLPKDHRSSCKLADTAFEPTRTLEEGDVVDLGDRALEVLHLPGHSPGSIGLWDAVTGTLFSGDAVYDGPLIDGLQGSNREAYEATMKRLLELPVNVVHAGHNGSFGRERLHQLVRAFLE
ncbi:MBL fold metallo-hydrolase, partial [Aquidulcibacter sp.]|uniref:MBL fold metallo-hydrolase n=1 Tax=Aquidulcibacter sp. TaxID=2052990 RepID=UPI0037BF622A